MWNTWHILQKGGHTISGFTCDAAVEYCYSRNLRGHSRIRQCPTCIAGGIRSFAIPNVWSIKGRLHEAIEHDRLRQMTLSSVATVLRTESASDLSTPDFLAAQRQLELPFAMVYANAKRWIAEHQLDAVVFFNGRMDLTTALRAACEDMDCKFVTLERTWFGHGLQLIPNENCLGLGEIGRLNQEFRELPLLADQAAYAGRIAADRFRQRNKLEWRLYNAGAERVNWPNAALLGRRVLILPSSRNEFEGHPDYAMDWVDYTLAFDAVLERLGIDAQDCVLRCHPNWAESIGLNTGWRSEDHWTSWAKQRGMTIIRSSDRADTYSLIGESDYVMVNGSSAGLEAALRGRKVICVGHATYEHAGFVVQLCGPEDLPRLDALGMHDMERTARMALRYVYTHGRRYAQFVQFVRALTTLSYEYYAGADPERLVRLCKSGILEPDDAQYGDNTEHETVVVNRMLAGDWDKLGEWQEPTISSPRLSVRRRFGLRWIEPLRNKLARGDL
jgi:hypothetical protein